MRHRLIFSHAYLRKQIHRHVFTDTIHGHRTPHIILHRYMFTDTYSQTQYTHIGHRHVLRHRHRFIDAYSQTYPHRHNAQTQGRDIYFDTDTYLRTNIHRRSTQTQDTDRHRHTFTDTDTGIKHISTHIQHQTHDTTHDADTHSQTQDIDIDTFTPTPTPTLSHIPVRFAGWRNSAIPTLPPFPRAFSRLLPLFLLLLLFLAVLFRDPPLREYRALLRKYRALLKECRALLGDMVMEGWDEGAEKRSHLFAGSFLQMYRADLCDHGALLSYTLVQGVLEE